MLSICGVHAGFASVNWLSFEKSFLLVSVVFILSLLDFINEQEAREGGKYEETWLQRIEILFSEPRFKANKDKRYAYITSSWSLSLPSGRSWGALYL